MEQRKSYTPKDSTQKPSGNPTFAEKLSLYYKTVHAKYEHYYRGGKINAAAFLRVIWKLARVEIVSTNAVLAMSSVFVFMATSTYAYFAYLQWEALDRTVRATETATNLAMQSAALSAQNSRKAIDQFRLDQRAWVGVIEAVPPATTDEFHRPTFIKEGFPGLFGVVITNSGKSPARKAVSLINTILLPKTVKFSPYYGTPEFAKNLRPGIDVIFPGMKMTQTATPRAPLNAAEVQIIKSGKSIFYMYGKISYEDVFRKPHWTTFCMFLAPTGDRFYSCPTYNDAD